MSDSLELLLFPVLLCLSAFFSSSETALFSLSRTDRHLLRESQSPGGRSVLELLERPGSLLVAVLFGNLLVNFLLYAAAAHVISGLGPQAGPGLYVLGAVLSTGLVIVLGEVAPKAVAVTKPRQIALLTAPPLLLFRTVILKLGLLTPLERMVAGLLWLLERRLPPPKGALSDDELRRFVALQGEQGLLERRSSQLLAEALELRARRAHEVMTPRVDVIAFDIREPRQAFLDLVREHRVGKVLVHGGEGLDKIYGSLRTRDVLAQPEAPLEELVRPCWFVPHTKSLEVLLREMIERDEHLVLVVGEYGGTAGVVTLEDVVEEITGDIAREDAPPLLERLEDDSWAMAGSFPLREVGELLDIQVPTGPTTLAGFVAELLDRIPEVGDVVWHAGIQLRVEAVDRRRATRVRLALPGGARPPVGGEPGDEMTVSGAHRANVRLHRWIAESNPDQDPVQGEDRP